MDLKGKKVLVVGLAKTGMVAAKFLADQGAIVTVTDIKGYEELKDNVKALSDLTIKFELNGHRIESFESADLIVVSPGVPLNIFPLLRAKEKNVEIISEIELAYRFIRTPIIAVTGTNGKTTTTALIGEILKSSGYSIFVGGNIGNPLVEYILSDKDADYVVAEISSFQLEAIKDFKAFIALILNISEDHMDRHTSFDDYIFSKLNIFNNQTEKDYAVLNKDDLFLLKYIQELKAKTFWFSRKKKVISGCYVEEGRIVFVDKEKKYGPALEDIPLPGVHNIENVMAAWIVGEIVGINRNKAIKAIRGFQPFPHRLQKVAEIKGVLFYNDSKGTNVGATLKALESFKGSLILIMGGKDKGGSYAPLAEEIKKKVKAMILMGEAKERIFSALGDLVPTEMVKSLNEAVIRSFELAQEGDIVLFSPACSSFDMFVDYKERGRRFIEEVKALEQKVA